MISEEDIDKWWNSLNYEKKLWYYSLEFTP